MFESDDWIFDVTLNDIHGKSVQAQSQCESKEETSSANKRRKVDGSKTSFSTGNNTCEVKVNVTEDTKDYNSSCSNSLLGNNFSDSGKSNVTREHLLLGIFQNTCQEAAREKQHPQLSEINTSSSSLCKQPKEKNSMNCTNKTEASKRTKLIRIFPGPAGLVARMRNDENSVASYLNSIKQIESKATEYTENNFPKLSQDDKNLLNDKAWKFLLDDLPKNFFNEYGISTVKNKANTSHCNSMKVKFVAGILDYIDYSHNDPFIILKDTTDSIEGTVHRNIPLKYPGVLEPNVVVLLHDVGLLKTTTHVVTNKYHILVSGVNLLAVYSNKGRIIHTSHMENLLFSNSNVESTRDDCSTPISNDHTVGLRPTSSFNVAASTNQGVTSKPTLVNNPTSLLSEKHEVSKQDLKKNANSKDRESAAKVFESFEDLIDMDDDMNDTFFTIELPASDENFKHSSSESTIVQSSEIQRRELQTRSVDHLESASEDSFAANSTNKIKSASPMTKLTKRNTENSKNLANYFTGEVLQDSEFDSDDEILSQLDVDNVVCNHKKEIKGKH